MTRIGPMSGVCAVLLLGWAAPGDAGCLSAVCERGAPAPIYVPPVALHQIETASLPFGLAIAPPPPRSDGTEAALTMVAVGTPGGLTSIADLDGGVAGWGYIAPGAGFDKLPPGALTGVAAIHPARQRQPPPQRTEIAVGAHLSLEVPVVLRPAGVPGIDRISSAGGNRSLWFASEAGR